MSLWKIEWKENKPRLYFYKTHMIKAKKLLMGELDTEYLTENLV